MFSTTKAQLLTRSPIPLRAVLQAARITMKGRRARRVRASLGPFADSEYRVFSQNGEDGLLDRIFLEIGLTNRRFCEFGFSTMECNALLLAYRHGFGGLWIDGNPETARMAQWVASFMGWKGVKAISAFITRENINSVLAPLASECRAIDLLSVDIDGNDYWVLEAIEAVRPRVLVAEYNAIFGAERSLTIPYDPAFSRYKPGVNVHCFGASLKALEKLAARKGYRLIGGDSTGVNAFYLDCSIEASGLPTVTSEQCWRPMKCLTDLGQTMEQHYEWIADQPLVKV